MIRRLFTLGAVGILVWLLLRMAPSLLLRHESRISAFIQGFQGSRLEHKVTWYTGKAILLLLLLQDLAKSQDYLCCERCEGHRGRDPEATWKRANPRARIARSRGDFDATAQG